MEVVVLGGSEFTLGFELAGARSVVTGDNKPEEEMKGLLADKNIGILILDQKTFNLLSVDTKEELVNSLQPVSVVLSEEGGEGELRNMIIKSIGVDLWKSEE